jgi:hypothetical protein
MTIHIGWLFIILIVLAVWYFMKHRPVTTQ